MILTNPPFGTKGANQAPERDDFTVSTSNKQLNFIQHVMTILKPGGRAAVVVPDNCLFADQAGEVFKILMEDCDLHTVLRLPRRDVSPLQPGIKTNVVFFTKGRPTETHLDLRRAHQRARRSPRRTGRSTAEHFAEFEKCYGADPNGQSQAQAGGLEGRPLAQLPHRARSRSATYKLDGFKWLKDDSLEDADDLPEPEELATDAITELEAAVEELNKVLAALENGNGGKR